MKNIDPNILSLNEGQLRKHHLSFYESVLDYVKLYFKGGTDGFRENFYIYYYELTSRPICKWCNGHVNFWKFETGYKQFCSNTCSGNYKKSLPQDVKDATTAKRKQTCKAVYGVENAAKSEAVKSKIKETNLEKYGCATPLLNKEIQEKRRLTYTNNWGSHPLSNKRNIEKRSAVRKNGMADKWQDKIVSILKDRYVIAAIDAEQRTVEIHCGACGTNSVLYQHNIQQRVKSMDICMQCNPLYSDKTAKNQQTLAKYKALNIIDTELLSFNKKSFTCSHLSKKHEFTINTKILYDRIIDKSSIICTICNPVGSGDSSHQIDIKSFLDEHGVEYTYNDKFVLGNNKHLDFYIPAHNLAIEFNGVYWHSEIYKDSTYHLDKTMKCLESGVTLVHVFEDDWIYKRDIIKSILLNKLNLVPNKLYARKCVIKEVLPKEANGFLSKNHIQGSCNSSLKYGLYYEGSLVSLMTFGYRKTNTKREFELIRFCNLLNTTVVGASSKLFKHFLKTNPEKLILSYSDLSMFDGKMYEMLGFKRIHLSKPNYFWVVNSVREHRYKYNKQQLIKDGFDATKTEVAIMHERGFYRIWGCGQVRWLYEV